MLIHIYRFDIDNGDYIQIKNTKKKDLKVTNIKLYNQIVDDTSEWNKSLVLKDAVVNGKYNQYYYSSSSNKWIEYRTYNKFTDYAIDVLGSNLNVVGTNDSLKMEGVKSYSDLK
mgnify:CR=1 FL=1